VLSLFSRRKFGRGDLRFTFEDRVGLKVELGVGLRLAFLIDITPCEHANASRKELSERV
jgi:hypothetical protein